MKKKVYLQYPWKFPDSPYYKYLVDFPPENIEFLNVEKQAGVIVNKKVFLLSNFLKKQIRYWLNKFNISKLNIHKTPRDDYDLIHCAHCLSKNQDKPWVADIESPWSMAVTKLDSKKSIKKIEKILLRDSCKSILPWTLETKKKIVEMFPKVRDKVKLLYPAVPPKKIRKKTKNEKQVNVIFVSRYFHIKGGLIALEVMEELRKEHNIKGVIISETPKKIKKNYPNLEFHRLLPQKKLFEKMSSSDIFLYPCFSDTFGFSLLEAMSFGIPIIALETPWTPSISEIVQEGVHGYIKKVDFIPSQKELGLSERKIVRELVVNTEKLISNAKLRLELSNNCLKEIKQGKFSISQRNKKLERIYKNAIKKKL